MAVDWAKARKEYVAGGVSYADIARKYGASKSAVFKRANAENWMQMREQAAKKSIAKTMEAVAAQGSQIDTAVFDAAMKLLDAFTKSVTAVTEGGEAIPPSMLKDYGTALKSIQSVLEKPTELDVREQKARIEKLEKDIRNTEGPSSIEVTVKGWDSEWAK